MFALLALAFLMAGAGGDRAHGLTQQQTAEDAPLEVTVFLDQTQVEDASSVLFRTYQLSVRAPGATRLKVEYDVAAFTTTTTAEADSRAGTVTISADSLTLPLNPVAGFSGESTTLTITATDSTNQEVTKTINLDRAEVDVRQRNLTSNTGPTEGKLTVTRGDCVELLVEVAPVLPDDQGTLTLSFPAAVFTVGPDAAGDCAPADQQSPSTQGITTSLDASGTAMVRLLVSESADPGRTPESIGLDLLARGEPVKDMDVPGPLVVTVAATQSVEGRPVGDVARLNPGEELTVTIDRIQSLPPQSFLVLTYAAPLRAQESTDANTSFDPDNRQIVLSDLTSADLELKFDIPETVLVEQRGRELAMSIELVAGDAKLAANTVRQLIPRQVAVHRELVAVEEPSAISPDGAPVDSDNAADAGDGDDGSDGERGMILAPGATPSMVTTVRNNDDQARLNVTVVDEFDLSFFEKVPTEPNGQTSATTATQNSTTDITPECEQVEEGDDGGRVLRCTALIDRIEKGDEVSYSYPVRVRAGLNVGEISTEVRGTVSSNGAESQPLSPLNVRVGAPKVAVTITAPQAISFGETRTVTVSVSNSGPGVARQMSLALRVASGAKRVVQVKSSDGDVIDPRDGNGSLTIELGDIEPSAAGPSTHEFEVTFSETGSETVGWEAELKGSATLTASASSAPVATLQVGGSAPDRIEGEKLWMTLIAVGAPLVALILLPLLGRWVPGTSQVTVNRLVEGVLVVFLASIVLVMNLAGGLEAESAAAIIGGIAGYIFGRGISDVGADRARDRPSGEPERPTETVTTTGGTEAAPGGTPPTT